MSATKPALLTDEDLMELDDLLLSAEEGEEDRLSVDEAHGYITALAVSGSERLETGDWLEDILGESQDDARPRMEELLIRLKDELLEMLSSTEIFEPLIAEEEEDGEVFVAYEGWCYGFMLAVSNDEDAWSELPKDEQDLLMPIAKLALLDAEEEDEIDEEEYEMLAELIPGSVKGLAAYWHPLH